MTQILRQKGHLYFSINTEKKYEKLLYTLYIPNITHRMSNDYP